MIKKPKLIKMFPKVKHFAISKLVCAAILKNYYDTSNINVAMEAVNREIEFGYDSSNS